MGSAPNSYSNGAAFISAPLPTGSFHRGGPCNERELQSLWSGQRLAALMNGRNTRRAECTPSFLFYLALQKPQDASWRSPPPSIAGSSLVKGGIKRRQRGKVIFYSCLSILLVGFYHFFAVYFHKAYNYLGKSPSSENEWGLCTLLSSALSCFWEGGSHISIRSAPLTDAARKPDVPPLKKKNEDLFQKVKFTNVFSKSPLRISEQTGA